MMADNYNWWAAQGQMAPAPPPPVGGVGDGGLTLDLSLAPPAAMVADDWRTLFASQHRLRILNKIMETLKRHLPFCGPEGLQELRKIAVRFEEKIYNAAESQSDYLRNISLKMLTLETKSQNPIRNAANTVEPLHDQGNTKGQIRCYKVPARRRVQAMVADDWRTQLTAQHRPRIVNKIMETLKRHLPFCGPEGLQELRKIAVRFEEKIYNAAESQSDYLRNISLKMLTLETKSQNPIRNAANTVEALHGQGYAASASKI